MFGSAIIDIAIGIVFVFLLVSVLASTINEIILSKLNMRGRELLEGLKTLLDDKNTDLVSKLYNHGQIFGLFKGDFDPKKPGNLPSYIPSRNFVMAFLDVVPAAASALTPPASGAPRLPAPPASGAPGLPAPSASGAPGLPAPSASGAPGLPAPPASGAPGLPAPPASGAPRLPAPSASGAPGLPAQTSIFSTEIALLTSLREAAEKLAAPGSKADKIGKPLLSMLTVAGNDAAKLERGVEDWFNSAMDRVSGWYKYRTQWNLFGIGLALAGLLNANTVAIVQQLSKDSALRQSIVAAAGAAKQPGAAPGQTADQAIEDVKKQVKDINSLGIPLGWNVNAAAVWDFNKVHWLEELLALFGWLTTALAASLGAPFWFDMLNKIMVVRSTVKPREKSQEEGSKDTTKPTSKDA